MSTLVPEDFTVGWICALPVELAAAQQVLDEEYTDVFSDHPNDDNQYYFGAVGPHKVVIACLPKGQIGNNMASSVASTMKAHFPNLKFGLMVGVGGGVPSLRHDIRLGDLVISAPERDFGGVVQYDLGKRLTRGCFERTGFLNAPPSILLQALTQYEAKHQRRRSAISILLQRFQDLVEEGFAYPGSEPDNLFLADYDHVPDEDGTCSRCDNAKVVSRKPRSNRQPKLHTGTIASGNQVIKDGVTRNELSSHLGGVLCFEMEAAGLMNSFPCLVIRGICDYSDSHKNKAWQPYAAAVAAAGAYELLSGITPSSVERSTPIGRLILEQTHAIKELVAAQTEAYNDMKFGQQAASLSKLEAVSNAAFDSQRFEHFRHCHKDTRKELLRDIDAWRNASTQECIFWLRGMAGSGKSTIARTLARTFSNQGHLAASFFFSRGGGDLGRATKFFPTLAFQMAVSSQVLRRYISDASAYNDSISQKFLSEQWKCLIMEPLAQVDTGRDEALDQVIVIDALDECENDKDVRVILQLLSQIRDLTKIRLKIFITSRPETPIRLGFENMPEIVYRNLVLHHVDEALVDRDIFVFLQDELEMLRCARGISRGWPDQRSLQQLVLKSDRLFIYAATVCRFLGEAYSRPQERLSQLLQEGVQPRGSTKALDDIYSLILTHSIAKIEDDITLEDHQQRFRLLVGSIIVLFDMQSSQGLADILALGLDDVYMTLLELHSVIDIPQDPHLIIGLLHPSFRDFLLDSKRCQDEKFYVDKADAHLNLAVHSFRVLLKGLKRDIFDLRHPATNADEVSSDQKRKFFSKALQYACMYVFDHVEQSGNAGLYDLCDKQTGVMRVFFDRSLLFWMEAMAWFERTSHSIEALMRIQSRIPAQHQDLRARIRDAHRFALAHRSAIERTPLQIYAAALAFTPSCSLQRAIFEDDEPQWLLQSPGFRHDWGPRQQTLENFENLERQDGDKPLRLVTSRPIKTYVACGLQTGDIRVWDMATGSEKLLHSAESNQPSSTRVNRKQRMTCIAISPNLEMVAAGRENGTMTVWDLSTSRIQAESFEKCARMKNLVFSPDSNSLFTVFAQELEKYAVFGAAFEYHRAQLRDAKTLAQMGPAQTIKNSDCFISSFEGATVALFSRLSRLTISKSVPRGCETIEFTNSAKPTCLSISPDGTRLALGYSDGQIQVRDLSGSEHPVALQGHDWDITNLVFFSENQLLASGSNDGTVRIWLIQGGRSVHVLEAGFRGDLESVEALLVTDNGLLVSGTNQGTIRTWNVSTGNELGLVMGSSSCVKHLAFSIENLALFSIFEDTTIQVWDIETMGLGDSTRLNRPDSDLVMSPDNRLGATVRYQHILIWDAVTGDLKKKLGHGLITLRNIKFTSDGSRLGWFSENILKVANISDDTEIMEFKAGTETISNYEFSPDGTLMGAGFESGRVRLWGTSSSPPWQLDLRQSKTRGRFRSAKLLRFSSDGTLLATVLGKTTIRVWTARQLALPEGKILVWHPDFQHLTVETAGEVQLLAFSPQGQTFVCALPGPTFSIYEVSTGHLTAVVNIEASAWDSVAGISFAFDGRSLIYGLPMCTERYALDLKTYSVEESSDFSHYVAFDDASCKFSMSPIDVDSQMRWVTYNGQSLLFLPHDLSPENLNGRAIKAAGNAIGIASRDGVVRFLRIDPSRFDFNHPRNISGEAQRKGVGHS